MKKIHLIANWKTNPSSLKQAHKLMDGYRLEGISPRLNLVICPPTIFLSGLTSKFQGEFFWGAQDCFWEKGGAYTGEISPLMLRLLGVRYVIVGHSERREHLGETDQMINKKVKALLREKLVPILCLGGGKEAKSPKANIRQIVRFQFERAFEEITQKDLAENEFLITYEPPWALSTVSHNRPASSKFAAEAAFYILNLLSAKYKRDFAGKIPILYGGSVNSSNILTFLKKTNLSGFLVGGASLNPKEFSQMIKLVS